MKTDADSVCLRGAAGDFGMFACELTSGRILWSAESKELLGLERFAEAGMVELLARLHADDQDRIAASFARAFTAQAGFDEECRILLPDGSRRWIQLSGRVAPDGVADRLEMLVLDITARKRLEAEQRELMRQLIEAQENERRHVARALHDRASQTLSALSLNLKTLADLRRDGDHEVSMQRIQALAVDLEAQLHAAAAAAHPTALDDIGLRAALDSLVADWADRSGVEVVFAHAACDDVPMSASVQIALYRCIAAVLTDIARRREAMRVSIEMERTPRALHVRIEEATLAPVHEGRLGYFGVGVAGLRERLGLIGATVTMETNERAARLFITVPLDPEAA